MLRFVPPDPAYHRSWVEAAAEFEAEGEFIHGSGLAPDDLPDAEVKGPIFRASAMRDAETFAAYCTEMTNRQHPEAAYAIGMVPDTKLFIVDGDEFVGMLSLRVDMAVSYSLPETLVSLVAAVGASAGALLWVARKPTIQRIVPAGILLGLGVCVMHYLGMYGMRFGGLLAVNVMRALSDYAEAVTRSLECGIDAVVVGAGLPLDLPDLAKDFPQALLVPILSDARGVALVVKKWERKQRLPDAIVIEHPGHAGGHLGAAKVEIWWHRAESDADSAVGLATKRGVCGNKNGALGEGLVHTATWLLCGTTETSFASLPATSTGTASRRGAR